MASLVQCMVCGKFLKFVNAKHLQTHGMTSAEYQDRWPGSPMQGDETVEKRAEARRGTHYNTDPETESERRRKISETLTGTHRPEEVKRKIGNGNRGKSPSLEARAKMSESAKGNTSHLGCTHSPEARRKLAESWARTISSTHLPPQNKLEKHFEENYEDYPIVFTGDDRSSGIKLANGHTKVPDFIVPGTKIVIELYGDYWHRNDDPQDLIDQYAEVGYECIVYWEHEVYELFPK